MSNRSNRIIVDPPEQKPGVYYHINNKLISMPHQFLAMERSLDKFRNDFMADTFDRLHTEED